MQAADAAGRAREPGASRAQPRGRRGGGEREPEPEPSGSQCWRGAAGRSRSRGAAAMAVAVGRPSVSAGASFPWPAPPPARGGPCCGAGAGVNLGARTGAAVAESVCMDLGARLGLRRGRGTPRLGHGVMQQCLASLRPDSQDVGGKGPLSYFPLRKILVATVFLGCRPPRAHTFSLVTAENGTGCGGFLPFPPRGGAAGAWGCLAQAPCVTRRQKRVQNQGVGLAWWFPRCFVRSRTPPGIHPGDRALPRMCTKALHLHTKFSKGPLVGWVEVLERSADGRLGAASRGGGDARKRKGGRVRVPGESAAPWRGARERAREGGGCSGPGFAGGAGAATPAGLGLEGAVSAGAPHPG